MMETSTSVNKLNYEQSRQEGMAVEDLESYDLMFYNNIKSQLDQLSKAPSDETISKILAYSASK